MTLAGLIVLGQHFERGVNCLRRLLSVNPGDEDRQLLSFVNDALGYASQQMRATHSFCAQELEQYAAADSAAQDSFRHLSHTYEELFEEWERLQDRLKELEV